MKTCLICFISCFYFVYTAHSQLNLGFDADCSKRNAAVISKELIDVYGDHFVGELLDSNTILALFWEVDQTGRVRKSKSFRHFTIPSSVNSDNSRTIYFVKCPVKFPKRFHKRLRDSLKSKDIRFEICVPINARDIEKAKSDAISHYSKKKRMDIVTEFPGKFKDMYYNRKPEDRSLTKLEFLKMQINMCLPAN